jgi:hypothetical protein
LLLAPAAPGQLRVLPQKPGPTDPARLAAAQAALAPYDETSRELKAALDAYKDTPDAEKPAVMAKYMAMAQRTQDLRQATVAKVWALVQADYRDETAGRLLAWLAEESMSYPHAVAALAMLRRHHLDSPALRALLMSDKLQFAGAEEDREFLEAVAATDNRAARGLAHFLLAKRLQKEAGVYRARNDVKRSAELGAAVTKHFEAALAESADVRRGDRTLGELCRLELGLDAAYRQADAIPIESGPGGTALQTLAAGPDGRLYAVVARPRLAVRPDDKALADSEVRVLAPDGKAVATWKLDFAAQAVNAAPDGEILVAGSGRIARFDAAGKKLAESALPHVARIQADSARLKRMAEDRRQADAELWDERLKAFEAQRAELTAKPADQRTPAEATRLTNLDRTLESLRRLAAEAQNKPLEAAITDLTARLGTVTAVAASDKDVFVAGGELTGPGYSVWRYTRALTEPKQVLTRMSGCCGQFDVQAVGGELVVAENTRHRVARYDRDGKLLGTFGRKGRDDETGCFGSCCNPMNVRGAAGNLFLCAESEGQIKGFTRDGKPAGLIATLGLPAGCKHVAVAASPDGSRVYLCDVTASRIVVFEKKAAAAAGN